MPFFIVMLIALVFCQMVRAGDEWPIVSPFMKSFSFSSSDAASVDVKLLGVDKRPLYRLQCHNYSYEDDPNFDYSGDFECKLNALYSDNTARSLFLEMPNSQKDWESRARFLADDVRGRCAIYPDYGKIRTIKLRGMEISFDVSNIKFKIDQDRYTFGSFDFTVSVVPDSSVKSEFAESSIYQEPQFMSSEDGSKKNCDVVFLKKSVKNSE